jgi:transcription factor IIIB subunit 2
LIYFGVTQSRLAGSILASIESGYSISHQRTLDKGMVLRALIYFTFRGTLKSFFGFILPGKDEIRQIVNSLNVSGGETIVNKAYRLYEICISVISK